MAKQFCYNLFQVKPYFAWTMSVSGFSRAGGDGGCVAGLSVVWCARSGSER